MGNRTSLVVLVGAMIVAGGGIFAIVRQSTPIVEIAPAPPPAVSAPTPATAAPSPSASSAPSGPAIYRCKVKGAVVYSDEPCGEGAKIVDVQPTRGYGTPRSSTKAAPSADAKSATQAPQALPPVDGSHATECRLLEDQIASIDAAARQGGTTSNVEDLKERRRKLVDRKYELRC